MAQAIIHDGRARALDATNGFVARLRQSFADWRVYRATIQELEQLTDRELADLGIHRASIRDIARESVYGG